METVENVTDSSPADDFSELGGGVAVDQSLELPNELVETVEEGDLHLRERAESHRQDLQFASIRWFPLQSPQFLRFERVDLRDNRRKTQLDMLQQQLVQLLAQKSRSVLPGDRRVMLSQKRVLVLPLHLHALPRLDVSLSAVDHAHIPQSQRNHAIAEDIHRVRAAVHQIQLGYHAHRAKTLRIHLASHLDRVAVRQVGVRSRDGHDDAVGLANELQNHPANDHFDVFRLVAHRNATIDPKR